MTKYYNQIRRNYINLMPEASTLQWSSEEDESFLLAPDILRDNAMTASVFFELFNHISVDGSVARPLVQRIVRSSLRTFHDEWPSWVTLDWSDEQVTDWIYDVADLHGLNSKSSSLALRRLLMLSLLLSHDTEIRAAEPWYFLHRYLVPDYVISYLSNLFQDKGYFTEYRWNKLHHAASVGLRCLIDSYAIVQGSLLHDIDKTDSDGELHRHHVAGHHNLRDAYSLPRFVEAAHDVAATTEVKGWPCIMQDVDGMLTAVESCLQLYNCPHGVMPHEFMDPVSHRDEADLAELTANKFHPLEIGKYYGQLLSDLERYHKD